MIGRTDFAFVHGNRGTPGPCGPSGERAFWVSRGNGSVERVASAAAGRVRGAFVGDVWCRMRICRNGNRFQGGKWAIHVSPISYLDSGKGRLMKRPPLVAFPLVWRFMYRPSLDVTSGDRPLMIRPPRTLTENPPAIRVSPNPLPESKQRS